MRQFPFGTSENPETPKSLLRSDREDIFNQKSMIRMVPNLQHTKTIHCLNFYQRPTTPKRSAQKQKRIRKQPMRTNFHWAKNRHHLVVACSWDDQNGLEVGSKNECLLLSVSNQNSSSVQHHPFSESQRKKWQLTAMNCGFGSAAPSMKLRELPNSRPWDVRWSTESFQASSPWFPAENCPTGVRSPGHGDPPGLETGEKTPKTIWMCIENIENLGKHIPPKKN